MTRKEQVAIRSEGAELYVAAHLMLEYGVPVSIASRNMPGYDLTAHNPDAGLSSRIQVKYRSAVNADGARLKHLGFDFMVYVAGNIGRIGSKVPLRKTKRQPTELFVLPVEIVKASLRRGDLFRSPTRGDYELYRSNWALILDHLALGSSEHPIPNTVAPGPPAI